MLWGRLIPKVWWHLFGERAKSHLWLTRKGCVLHTFSRINGYQKMPPHNCEEGKKLQHLFCVFSQSEEFSDLWQAGAPLKITSIPGGLRTWGTFQQKHLKYSLVLALPCSFLLCVVSYSLWSPSTESYYIFKGLQSLRKSNWFVAPNLLVELLRKKLFNLIFHLYLEPLAWIQPASCTHKLWMCAAEYYWSRSSWDSQ